MSRLLLIVSRSAPARYAYFKHMYGNETMEVIVDRRLAERRRHVKPLVHERRREARRHRDITEELEIFGWALVRH